MIIVGAALSVVPLFSAVIGLLTLMIGLPLFFAGAMVVVRHHLDL